jgi:hypothetical protein
MEEEILLAGPGAQATVLPRFVYPKGAIAGAGKERITVTLIGSEKRTINKKEQDIFTFTSELAPSNAELFAIARYVKVVHEGSTFFNVPDKKLKEPKSWRNSRAKRLLYDDVKNAVVPLEAKDEYNRPTLPLKDIYLMHPEYARWRYDRFGSRLATIRKSVRENDKRSDYDRQLFEKYVTAHPISLYSHHGYIQWQGSEAQAQLKEDLENNLHRILGPKQLWSSNFVYYHDFPLSVFREKIAQEERTAKYLFTTKIRRGFELRDADDIERDADKEATWIERLFAEEMNRTDDLS